MNLTPEQIIELAKEAVTDTDNYFRVPRNEVDEWHWLKEYSARFVSLIEDAVGKDAARLDWLDEHPTVILRSGKQHIRPFIDAAMAQDEQAGEKLRSTSE